MSRAAPLILPLILLALTSGPAPAAETFPMRKPVVAAPAPTPAAPAENPAPTPAAITPAAGDNEGENAAFAADAEKPVETVETDLPDYPAGALRATGKAGTYKTGESDTLLDVARFFDFGYVELRAANAALDPWAPGPETEVVLPGFDLLPRAPQRGILVNLSEMRLYYFYEQGRAPVSMPIGIGREGLQTPTGETTVLRKQAGPTWFPTERMLEEKPYLPKSVPPGPANPLGTHALYLGWPTFLIHGANKPWSIGRRVSSGCMRLYPDDIRKLFGMVPVGTKVTVVDQPVKMAWLKDGLYLQVHPSKVQSYELENGEIETPEPITDKMRAFITKEAGAASAAIDWTIVEKAFLERRGVPVMIVPTLTDEKPATTTPASATEEPKNKKPADAFSDQI